MDRIRNIFGKVNTFVRGTFNYVLGHNSDEELQDDQENKRETIEIIKVEPPKSNPKGKRKNDGKKKKQKSVKRNGTPSRRHPRQKQITVKIPQGPELFNTEDLLKVPTKSHKPINCFRDLMQESDGLLISEKTVHLDNAIKYGNKAEAIDVRDELAKQLPQREDDAFLPSISQQTSHITKCAGSHSPLKEKESSSLSCKRDDVKKPSIKNKSTNEDRRLVFNHGLPEDQLKLPDIRSCQGSLVSQPISCSDRNSLMATAVTKQLSTDFPTPFTAAKRISFLGTLETIQEKVDEKYFNSQPLKERENRSHQNEPTFFEQKCHYESSNLASAEVQISNTASKAETKEDATKDLNSLEVVQGKGAQDRHVKKSKKKKNKKKKKAKAKHNLNTGELDEALQDCAEVKSSKKLNPIGKSPLERIREIETKRLVKKYVQLGKTFTRSNKIAPLMIEGAGQSMELEVEINESGSPETQESTSHSSKLKPLLLPLKTEQHRRKEKPSSLSPVKVPAVLMPPALPRIFPRCQSPKIFTDKAAKQKSIGDHENKCAELGFTPFVYEQSDDDEEQEVRGHKVTSSTNSNLWLHTVPSSLMLPPFVREPSDDSEESFTSLTAPKRKFTVQDRLRISKRTMSHEKEYAGNKFQTSKTEEYKPFQRDVTTSLVDGIPRFMPTPPTVSKGVINASRYLRNPQEHRRLLPSLNPSGQNMPLKDCHDDLKIMDLLDIEEGDDL